MNEGALKLFAPGESPDDGGLNVRKAYERFIEPDLFESGTKQAYETSIAKWEKYTPNPPINSADNDMTRRLRDGLLADGFSPATVRKTWTHVRAILRRCAPQTEGNPRGEGIITRIPWVKMPPSKPKIPRVGTHAELNAIYEACRVAEWPPRDKTGIAAPELYRTFVVLEYNYGPRTQDLWALEWLAIDWERKKIALVADKTSKLQGLPLNDVSIAHLQRIKRDRRHLFYPTRCKRQFYREWERINKTAGLSVPLEFRELRETCATNYEQICPGVGKWILGHAARGVTDEFYVNPGPHVLEAVHKLPQPSSFLQETPPPERQLRLGFRDED